MKFTSSFHTPEAKERPKKETEHSRLVVGSFSQQGNLHMRLVLGDWQGK